MMLLSDFLLARFAEDEEWAQNLDFPGDPARSLAECEAKRRIVGDLAALWTSEPNGRVALLREHFLRLLALPYADHPDYREEWKP